MRSLLLAGAALTAACATPARAAEQARETVHFSEFAFAPRDLELPAGREVVLTVVNGGKVDHDLVITEFGQQLIRLHGGRSATVTLRPLAAGTYHVICSIPTHADLGMVGTFLVR